MSENVANSRQLFEETVSGQVSIGAGIVAGVGALLYEYSNASIFGDTVFKNDKPITDAKAAQGDTLSHPASPQALQELHAALALPSSQTKSVEAEAAMVGSAAAVGLVVALGVHTVSRLVRRSHRSAV